MSVNFGGSRLVLPHDVATVVLPVASGVVISPGDLLYWDSSNSVVKPLSSKTGLGSAVLDQADIALLYAGVALQGRIAAQTSAGYPAFPAAGVSVAVDAVYEADCTSATFEAGDLVGVVSSGAAAVGAVSDQSLVAVTRENLSIGYVIARYASASTKVRVRLHGKTNPLGNPNIGNGIGARQGYASATLADSAVTLTVASAPIQVGIPTAGRTITLPAVAQSGGLTYWIVNNSAGAFSYTVQNAGASTIGTVAQNKRGQFFCDGTAWYALVGA